MVAMITLAFNVIKQQQTPSWKLASLVGPDLALMDMRRLIEDSVKALTSFALFPLSRPCYCLQVLNVETSGDATVYIR